MENKYTDAKIICIDFDNTIFIPEKEIDNYEWKMFHHDMNIYNGYGKPNLLLLEFLRQYEYTPMYCITHDSSYACEVKENYIQNLLDRNVPTFAVSNPDEKIPVMEVIANTNNVAKSDVLLIDDRQRTIELAHIDGFMAEIPQRIMQDIYVNLHKTENTD